MQNCSTDIKGDIDRSDGRKIFRSFLIDNFGSDSALSAFDTLTELYFEVNSVINISAIRSVDEVYIKHYLDSIQPYKHFDESCCDVGCGGGFPCIPLSIVTGLKFLGIDGVGKKLTLIRRAVSALGLSNLTEMHARSEELEKKQVGFDTVCSRALADTDKALTFCAALARPNGKIILYKTQNDERASAVVEKKSKTSLCKVIDYTLFSTDIKRRLFIYTKLPS